MHRCATADGVLLRPVSSREDRENVCISYGANNNKIVPTLRKEFSESDSTFIEAHGVVGREKIFVVNDDQRLIY